MRMCTIELSGSEVRILKDTLEILLGPKTALNEENRMGVETIEKILFGAGP